MYFDLGIMLLKYRNQSNLKLAHKMRHEHALFQDSLDDDH